MLNCTRSRPLGLLVLLLAVTVPLAATTVYTDWTGWEAGVSSYNAADFEGLTTNYVFYGADGVTQNGAQIIGQVPGGSPAQQAWVINPLPNPEYDFGTGSVLKGPYFTAGELGREIQIKLPGDTTAFAVDLMTVGSEVEAYTIMLSNGESWDNVLTAAGLTPQFFGITTDTTFSEVHLLLTTGVNTITYPVIDNVAYGIAGAVVTPPLEDPEETPEAATVILVATGLFFLWRRLRRYPSLAAS